MPPVRENPVSIESLEKLEEALSVPSPQAIDAIARLDGDVIVLGVGGKMGPSLSHMIVRAAQEAGVGRKVIGVSRFSSGPLEGQLNGWGIQTIRCDLLNQTELDQLPDAPNVVYMAGMKFGSTGNEALTWAMNSYLPGMVCQKFRHSKIVAFSTGNIYGLTPAVQGGPLEYAGLNPVGDYAMSCLGRERIFDHFSRTLKIPLAIIRLNYANELRYGVLVDLANRVLKQEPIDLAMGCFNAIWQADANAQSLAAFDHVAAPPFVLNVAGPELLSIRQVCMQFGQLLDKPVQFINVESPDALISNGQLGHRLFGYPSVGPGQMIRLIADWVLRGGSSLGKPTHFEARDGKF